MQAFVPPFHLRPFHLFHPPSRLTATLSAAPDEHYMRLALHQARLAASLNEVPIGAVLVDPAGSLLAAGHNRVESLHDVTQHAELVALRRATAAARNWRLIGATLYTTLEPCPMCLSALALARVSAVVYAGRDLRLGACGTWVDLVEVNHPFHRFDRVEGGVLGEEAAALMREFFRGRRRAAKERKAGKD